jgi:hypothetical protein
VERPDDTPSVANLSARVTRAIEALQDGEVSLAHQLLVDLEVELERAA